MRDKTHKQEIHKGNMKQSKNLTSLVFKKLQIKIIQSIFLPIKLAKIGTSLVAQWIRLHAPNAGGPDLIPGLGRSHMPWSN